MYCVIQIFSTDTRIEPDPLVNAMRVLVHHMISPTGERIETTSIGVQCSTFFQMPLESWKVRAFQTLKFLRLHPTTEQ